MNCIFCKNVKLEIPEYLINFKQNISGVRVELIKIVIKNK